MCVTSTDQDLPILDATCQDRPASRKSGTGSGKRVNSRPEIDCSAGEVTLVTF